MDLMTSPPLPTTSSDIEMSSNIDSNSISSISSTLIATTALESKCETMQQDIVMEEEAKKEMIVDTPISNSSSTSTDQLVASPKNDVDDRVETSTPTLPTTTTQIDTSPIPLQKNESVVVPTTTTSTTTTTIKPLTSSTTSPTQLTTMTTTKNFYGCNSNSSTKFSLNTSSPTTPILNKQVLESINVSALPSGSSLSSPILGGSIMYILKESEIVRAMSQVSKDIIIQSLKSISGLYKLTIDDTIEKIPKLKLLHVVHECICFTGIDDFISCQSTINQKRIIQVLDQNSTLLDHPYLLNNLSNQNNNNNNQNNIDKKEEEKEKEEKEKKLEEEEKLESNIKNEQEEINLKSVEKTEEEENILKKEEEMKSKKVITNVNSQNGESGVVVNEQLGFYQLLANLVKMNGMTSLLEGSSLELRKEYGKALCLDTQNMSSEMVNDRLKDEIMLRGTEMFLRNLKAPTIRNMAESLKINKIGTKDTIIEKIMETIFNFTPAEPTPPQTPIIHRPLSAKKSAKKSQKSSVSDSPRTPSTRGASTQPQKTFTPMATRSSKAAAAIAASNGSTNGNGIQYKTPLKTKITISKLKKSSPIQNGSSACNGSSNHHHQSDSDSQVEDNPILSPSNPLKRKKKPNSRYLYSDDEDEYQQHDSNDFEHDSPATTTTTKSNNNKTKNIQQPDEDEIMDSLLSEEEDEVDINNEAYNNNNFNNHNNDGGGGEEDFGDDELIKTPLKRVPLNPLTLIVKGITKDQLNTLYHAPDLKEYCKLNNMKPTGTKSEVMKRILVHLNKDSAKKKK